MPNGYTLNAKHIRDFSVEMTGKEMPITPPIQNNSEDQAGRDGGWDFGVKYDPKIIPIDHHIWTNSRAETQTMIRNLAGWLNPRLGAKQLIFDDEPDKMYFARLSTQINLEQIIKLFNDFSLEFICYDPFTYSVQEYTEIITSSGTISHQGTHVSKPVLVVDHAGGSATITNTTPDGQTQVTEFNADTPPGQYTIDMKEGTVKMGSEGGDKHINSIQWIEMQQGSNTIAHSVNINQVTVKYRHTWL